MKSLLKEPTMIRKIIAFVLFLTIAPTFSIAQTTKLTDEQVLELAKEASKNGDSEQQIAIQLRSKGVGRKQMERVKKLYQEEKNADRFRKKRPLSTSLALYQTK